VTNYINKTEFKIALEFTRCRDVGDKSKHCGTINRWCPAMGLLSLVIIQNHNQNRRH